ncbi:MAG: hypothetical protein JXR91_03390 [Deltaproteobacteria bacterium]|nr:hypothetical protein [Deltaproteobacteria bacterium]
MFPLIQALHLRIFPVTALHNRTFEYVVPSKLSTNTISTALIRKWSGDYYLGLFDEDLPAAQSFTGNSNLWVTPAWRLPVETDTMFKALPWIKNRLLMNHGLKTGKCWELGGNYYPSSGSTPEKVTPLCFEVLKENSSNTPVTWIRLMDLLNSITEFQDGHLRIVTFRISHALGLLTTIKS